MGLAASQARFLGLTARQSNVEFQGQQINQARTALSNEVNRLYDRYNELTVPVPPTQADYTKTTMKVASADEDYAITKYEKITDESSPYYGYYNVTMSYDEKVAQVYSNTVKNAIITGEGSDGNYSKLSFTLGANVYNYDESDSENSTIKKIDTTASDFDPDKYTGLEEVMNYDKEKTGSASQYYYMYTSEDTGLNYFTSGNDLNDTFSIAGKNTYSGSYLFEYQGSKAKTSERSAIASISQGTDGRLSAINIVSCSDDASLVGNSYEVNTVSSQDEAAYKDAMNDYTYQKDLYEREVEKINKQTEKLQTEDRSLELKLNQLDTEQRALKTEAESVQQVIKDTIDSVFKTYNS